MTDSTQPSSGQTKKCPKCHEDIQQAAKKCHHCNSDLRNFFMRHKIITVIGGLFVLGLLINAFGADTGKIDQSTTDTAKETVQKSSGNQDIATTPTAKSYQQIFTFSGNGTKKSEPFTITGSRFKIKYDCSGEFCQAFLYKAKSNDLASLIMNSGNPVKDETIIYGSGEYYIDANTIGNFIMSVEDYK